MSSDDDFDAAAYKTFEDQLYEEQSLSGSDDDLDSDVEEALYSRVHYASSLLVSDNSIPGEGTPKTRSFVDNSFVAQGQKCHLDSSVIKISSDDDDDDDSDGGTNNDGNANLSSSFSYPEVVNIFSDEGILTSIKKTDKESSLAQNEVGPGEIAENWDLNERDLQDSKATRQRPRYYSPGKGLAHVRCYNCNEKGHLSQNCPEPKKISVCFLCGGVGHVKRYCPNELCFNCYEPGHMSKQCRKPRRRPFDRCNRCHVLGHLANDCPDRWRQYHLTTEVGPIIRPDRPVSPRPSVYCYNCGSQGHYGHECREENATRRSELPLPFVVNYDGCQMPSFREKKNFDKRTPKLRPKNKRRNQPLSKGFYDQASQQDFDTDSRLFQPPPEKIRKIDDDADVRRVTFQADSYNTREFNSPYTDRTPKRKRKKNRQRQETAGGNERIVEILDPSPSNDGLIEEPYQFKKKKSKKRGKQQWQVGNSFDDNFDSIDFNARNDSKYRNDMRFSNPHRKQDFRSFEERQFDSRRTSSNPRRGNKDFTSNRGFRFNNEPRGKKSKPQFLKRYTF